MSGSPLTIAALRASDADREAAVDALRRHHTAGRLDTDELDQRVHAALAAQTVSELDVQLADLPRTADGYPTRSAPIRWSGPLILAAGGATVAISAGTDPHVLWLLGPMLWFARPWRRRRSTRTYATLVAR